MSSTYESNYDEVVKLIRRGAAAAVDAVSIATQAELKAELSKAGSGVHWPGQRYRSSAPGEAPTVQTGQLRRSEQVDRSRVDSKLDARVGTNLPYGKFLEYGTRRMDPRPWMRPVLHRMIGKAPGIAARAFSRVVG